VYLLELDEAHAIRAPITTHHFGTLAALEVGTPAIGTPR